MSRLTIVHTRRGMLLTKQPYESWRELQDQYEDFVASLGPYGVDDLFEYLEVEYPRSRPFRRPDVHDFLADPSRSEFWSPGDGARC